MPAGDSFQLATGAKAARSGRRSISWAGRRCCAVRCAARGPFSCPCAGVRTVDDWFRPLDGCPRCGYPYEREPGLFPAGDFRVQFRVRGVRGHQRVRVAGGVRRHGHAADLENDRRDGRAHPTDQFAHRPAREGALHRAGSFLRSRTSATPTTAATTTTTASACCPPRPRAASTASTPAAGMAAIRTTTDTPRHAGREFDRRATLKIRRPPVATVLRCRVRTFGCSPARQRSAVATGWKRPAGR